MRELAGFTALVVAQLFFEGRIDLYAPISQYLPDYTGPARDVAVRKLMKSYVWSLELHPGAGLPASERG